MSKPATKSSQTNSGKNAPAPSALSVVADKGRDFAASLESNPLAALLGGLALGAAAGALLPRSEKEKALLAPLGERLSNAAQAALEAGREAGAQALKDNELSVDGLRDQVSRLLGHAGEAASAAGAAAFSAARESVTK
jgi:hypothetical protein